MHGLIFSELKKFVVARVGPDAWNKVVAESGLGDKMFLPNQVYNDGDLVALVTAASKLTGIPAAALEEAFGEFIAPELLRMYQAQVNPAWRTLDVVEKTEGVVHRAVRLKVPGAQPPRLVTTRTSPTEVVLEYTSTRKMCPVAIGIIKGVGRHYKEDIKVIESECMLKGAPRCLITTRLAGPA